ncbi:hypothetical protein Ait01nite_024330 [Actinoplanes italicus]|nr:hypothetical protein Ait01nite_024330 [Actinoplanes italicus]
MVPDAGAACAHTGEPVARDFVDPLSRIDARAVEGSFVAVGVNACSAGSGFFAAVFGFTAKTPSTARPALTAGGGAGSGDAVPRLAGLATATPSASRRIENVAQVVARKCRAIRLRRASRGKDGCKYLNLTTVNLA